MKEQELKEILCQPFHYHRRGTTSKVYVSEDGRFVIKTFLNNKFASKSCKNIPIIRDFANKRRALIVQYSRSYGPIYAYQYIPKECGMIFYQFFRPRNLFHKSLELIEKDGSTTELDLDKGEYVIQKKAIIVSEYVKAHLARGDLEKVKTGLTKLIRFTRTLYDQGIVLVGLQFRNNFGFIDDEPVRIDVEHLRFDPKWKERGLKKEISTFRSWLVECAPEEVVNHFDSEIQTVMLPQGCSTVSY